MGKKRVLLRMPKLHNNAEFRKKKTAKKRNQNEREIDALRNNVRDEFPVKAVQMFKDKFNDSINIELLKSLQQHKYKEDTIRAVTGAIKDNIDIPDIVLVSYLFKCTNSCPNSPALCAIMRATNMLQYYVVTTEEQLNIAVMLVLCINRMLMEFRETGLHSIVAKLVDFYVQHKSSVLPKYAQIMAEYSEGQTDLKQILLYIIKALQPYTHYQITTCRSMVSKLGDEIKIQPTPIIENEIIEFKTFEPKINNSIGEKIKKQKDKKRIRKQNQNARVNAYQSSINMVKQSNELQKSIAVKRKNEITKSRKVMEELEKEYKKEKTSAHTKSQHKL